MPNSNSEKINITVEDTLSETVDEINIKKKEENRSEQRKKTALFIFISLFCLTLLFLSLFFAYKNSEIKREQNLAIFKENSSDWTEISKKDSKIENDTAKNAPSKTVQSYEEYKASLIKENTDNLQESSVKNNENIKNKSEAKENNTKRTGNRFNISFSPKISFGSSNKEKIKRQNELENKSETETVKKTEKQTGFLSDEISEDLVADRKAMLIHSESCPKTGDIQEEKRIELLKTELDNYISHGYNFCPYCKFRVYTGS